MKHTDKNRDPERAKKRAVADLRCAARKVGMSEAIRIMAELCATPGPTFDPQGEKFLRGWESR